MNRRNFAKIIVAGSTTVAGLSVFGEEDLYKNVNFWSPVGCPQNWQIPTYVDGTMMFGDEEIEVRVFSLSHKSWPYFRDEATDHEIFCPIYPKVIGNKEKFLEEVRSDSKSYKIHIIKCKEYPDLEGMFSNPRFMTSVSPDTSNWTFYNGRDGKLRYDTPEGYWKHVYDQGVSKGEI